MKEEDVKRIAAESANEQISIFEESMNWCHRHLTRLVIGAGAILAALVIAVVINFGSDSSTKANVQIIKDIADENRTAVEQIRSGSSLNQEKLIEIENEMMKQKSRLDGTTAAVEPLDDAS